MKALRRFLRVLLLALLLLLLPPLILLAALSTEPGSGWVLQQAARLAQSQGLEVRLNHTAGSLLDRVELQGINFQGHGVEFSAARLALQWSPQALLDRTLHLRTLQLDGVSLVLPPSAEQETRPPEVPQIRLPIAIRLDDFGVHRLRVAQGDSEQRIAALSLSVSLDAQEIAVRSLDVQMEGMQLDGRLSMQPSAPHTIDGRIAVELGPVVTGNDIGAVSAVVDLAGAALRPRVDLQVSRPADVRVRGVLRLEQQEPAFDLQAGWQQLGWPLQGQAEVRATEGRLALKGTAADYRLELVTQLDGDEIPPSRVDLVAGGDLDGLRIQALTVDVVGGRLLAKGDVGWGAQPRWDLLLEAQALDPGELLADWPGSIDGRVSVEGQLKEGVEGGLTLRADVEALSGTLRDQPFTARGRLQFAAGQLQAERLQIASGPNRVFVDGDAGERLDLEFDIDAPDLAAAYPGLSGRLKGAGQVGGRRDSPSVVARLSGERLGYQDSRADALDLDIDWRETGGSAHLHVQGLRAGERTVTGLTAQVTGSPASHRIDASADAEGIGLEFGAAGGLTGETWSGELSRLLLRENAVGEWRLDGPTRLELAKTVAHAQRFCLSQEATRVCGEGGWREPAGLDVTAELTGLDLARFAAYLPDGAEVSGRVDGEFAAKGPVERPRVVFSVRPEDGLVRFTQEGEPLEIAYRDVRVDGRFEDDEGRLDIRLELDEQGQARGGVSLGPDRNGQRALAGRLSADFPDLGLVAGFVPALDQVAGRLHLETTLGGTLDGPQVSGRLQVLDASARLPAAGITLSEVGLDISADGDTLFQVLGGVRSGQGRVEIEGEIDARSAGATRVDLRINGQDLQVARLPEALVEISPELRLQGVGPYHLSGTLKVPRSKIELRELPRSTVAVSDDEIVVGEQEESANRAPKNLTAKIRVELGDEVTFSGFGLQTGLTGVLDAATDGGGSRLDGRIELRDARYQAYGQDLTVERGRLLFAGPPTNPDVDVRAVRESIDGQVKAYLAVSGPLSKPTSRVYSEPALPDAEALAYLLTGRGLDKAGKGEGADIASAALALGMSKGDPLLQDLGDRFGLDELSLESGPGGIEESALVLGKYLNPDLYIGYSQGLFNPEGAVLLRLQLTERLEAESRSGNEQSFDLFYRLEHD